MGAKSAWLEEEREREGGRACAGGACGRRAMRRMCSSSKPGQVEGVRGTRNGRGGCRGVLVRCPVGSYAAGGYCRQTSQRGGHGRSPPALLVLATYVRGARARGGAARAETRPRTWRDEDGRERCGDGFTAWLKSHLKRPRKGLMGRSYPTRSKVTRKGARQRPFREVRFPFSAFHTTRGLSRFV